MSYAPTHEEIVKVKTLLDKFKAPVAATTPKPTIYYTKVIHCCEHVGYKDQFGKFYDLKKRSVASL